MISTSLLAFLYTTTQYKWLFVIPVIPYFTALAVTQNPIMAIEAVTFLPAGLALIFAVKKKFTLTATVITISASTAVYYLLYIIISIFVSYGAVNGEILESFRDEAITPFRELYRQMTTIKNGTEIRLYTDNQIEEIITATLRYIPAVVICVTNIISYISAVLYKGLAKLFGKAKSRHIIPDKNWNLTMSVVSAYIYSAAYLIVIFGGSMNGTIISVPANILIILTPGFSYIGLKDLIRRFKTDKGRKFAFAVIVLIAIFLVLSPSMIFYVMSLLGVAETFITNYTIKRSVE